MKSTGVSKPRPKRPARGAQNRRLGRSADIEQTTVSNQAGSLEQSHVDVLNNNVPVSQSHVSWSNTLAALEKESIASQTQRYKEWKRNGSVHEDYCRVCFQLGRLEPCLTCRLAFHSDCLPAGWLRNSQNQLFCVICVRRAWHAVPPALTPPTSPRLVETQGGLTFATSATELDTTLPSPHLLAASQRQPGTSPAREQRINNEQDISLADSNPEISPGNSGANAGVSQPTRRHRKSRYISLPSEVDASLNVLYRELESNTSLRSEIEELRNENTRCLQTIKIRDLSLLALHRELERRHSSEQEFERLQANAAQFENARKQLQELRVKNEALEAELQTSREAAKEAQGLVDDWKAKLSLLINN